VRILALLLAACTHGAPAAPVPDATPDVVLQQACTTGDATKLHFTRDTSCGNDGGVEWCIPANDASLRAAITAVSPSIYCAPGGGRANCNAKPGLLLCSYPTAFPAQCATDHGAMNDATWSDMCTLTTFAEITEIVPTLLE